jgi:Putative beta-barrel porin 2
MGSREWVGAAHRRGSMALAAFVTFLAAAPGSNATQPGYDITLGVGESNNIARLPSGGKSDTIGMEGADFTWHDQRPRLDTDIDADLQHLSYFNHTFSDEVIGNFLGEVRATLAKQLLFWDASDNFGQGRINPLAAVTPANRENINYLSTGPELMLPLAADTLVDVTTHYAKVIYQSSPLDSTRISGRIGLVRRISSDSSVSLNVSDERVNFKDDVANPDYAHEDAFVRYDGRGGRTVIRADLGFSKLRERLSPASGVLARLELSRKVSASSTVALSFGHQYSDAANTFVLGQTIGGANLSTQTTTQTGAPFTSNYGTLAWNYQRRRTGFGISASEYKETYLQSTTLNDNRLEIDAHVSRQLMPTLQFVLGEQYFHQKFQSISATSTETMTDAQLTWRAGRHISVMLDLNRANRHSSIAATGYTENRAWLIVGYGRQAQVPTGPATPPLPGKSLY